MPEADTSFSHPETEPDPQGPALPSNPSEGPAQEEPADDDTSFVHDEPEEPARDWEAELAEREQQLDDLASERDDLSDRVNDLEEQNAELLGQLETLKARLLDQELEAVQTAEGLNVSADRMAFVDRSLLVDENGLPNRGAITELVKLFGEAPDGFESGASDLGIGFQSGRRPDPHAGFGNDGHFLDARNRKLFTNPFRSK